MGAVTVITSGKGGVGKSTTAVGIGRALAKKGRRVLLLDCDAGLRSLDRMTGVEDVLVYDSADVVAGRCAPIEAIYPCKSFPGLFLMPAPARGEDMVRESVMKKLIPLLKQYYDHVLLDSPAGVGRGFAAAACGADRAIVVCNPDPVCVRSTAAVGELLKRLGIEKQRLVINRFNGELFGKMQVMEDLDKVIDAAGIRLLGVVPEDASLVVAVMKGGEEPKGCRGMLAMQRLAGRLEGENIPLVFPNK
ncbi:MAG: AAA family ATPase [Oscillospiraceae bacterium]